MLAKLLSFAVVGMAFGCGNIPDSSDKSSKDSSESPGVDPMPEPASSDSPCATEENVRLFGKVRKAKDVEKCYGLTLYDRYGGEETFSKDVASQACTDDGYLGYAFQLLCNDANGIVVDFGCGPGSCTVKVERSQSTCDAAHANFAKTKEKLATLAAPTCEADTDCAMFKVLAEPAECVADPEVLIGFQKSLVDELADTAKQSLAVTYMCIDEIKSGWCAHSLDPAPDGQCDTTTKTCRAKQ